MTVRTVLFDAGMTLIRPEPSFGHAFAAACAERQLTVAPDAVHAADHLWREHHDVWHAAGLPSPWAGDERAEARYFRELYARFLDELGVSCGPDVADHILERLVDPAAYGVFPEVPDVVADLERRGCTLGVISNWGTLLPLREVLRHVGLLDRLATVVISGEVGVAKPDPAIFAHALAEVGEQPGPHVAYVGDDPRADIAPARQLGLTPVLVDRSGALADHAGTRVTDLRELVEVVPVVAAAVRDLP